MVCVPVCFCKPKNTSVAPTGACVQLEADMTRGMPSQGLRMALCLQASRTLAGKPSNSVYLLGQAA